MKLESLMEIAITAALNAGREIMEVYASNTFSLEFKKDESPITLADRRANDAINEVLFKTDIPIISEENKIVDYGTRRLWRQCWVVDPLDGTKEFVKRNDEFTVNIALVEDGVPVLGVIYVPVTKELYCGLATKMKAYKIIADASSAGALSNPEILMGASKTSTKVKVVGSRSHMSPATENFISSLRDAKEQIEIISIGSSLKFCLMAEGKASIYPRFSPTMEWDTAAGHAICKAVGLNVIDAETKQPLKYNKKELVNPSFIVN